MLPPILPFFNRQEELRRLRRLFQLEHGSLGVLYGRRRCGKSRLILESASVANLIYYFGDDREAPIHRENLAREMNSMIPGFADVQYPNWEALLSRWFRDCPPRSILAMDEFPSVVKSSPELPSLLQKVLEARPLTRGHLLLCGSSQRMMQGLILDRTAPLYGRAREILKISPLPAGWLEQAFPGLDAVSCIEAYSCWGGVPRYWELAQPFATLEEAIVDLVLSPLGVLHDEPATLLQDDLPESVQSASILQLIGQGCQRLSELAARLQKPPTSLTRPLQRLLELQLIHREKPFGALEKESKRSHYRVLDPFLRFWFRCVGPLRSRLQARQLDLARLKVREDFPQHVGGVWEDLVREAVPWLTIGGHRWGLAQRWWGGGVDRKPLEIDGVAESQDGSSLLFVSAKWQENLSFEGAWNELRKQASNFPEIGARRPYLALFCKRPAGRPDTFGPNDVLGALS